MRLDHAVDQAIPARLLGDAGLIERAPAWDERLVRLKRSVLSRSGDRERPPARDVT